MRSEFLDGKVVLHGGDCRDVLRGLADASVDSVVTDPPYALVSIVKRFGADGAAPAAEGVYARAAKGFMGKTWDNGEAAFAVEFWAQVLRVLKPGGHVAAFSGTRTYHRLACAIEDAGFEIRDQLAWAYGSGFPKSHDVSKGIDKAAGAVREVVGKTTRRVGPQGTRKVDGLSGSSTFRENPDNPGNLVTAPATDAARQWQGWGTALKPAWEPIVLARKPLVGTVAANVLAHGTGALNINGCRVGFENDAPNPATNPLYRKQNGYQNGNASDHNSTSFKLKDGSGERPAHTAGRWPANIVHDGSDEVVAAFPETHSGGAPTAGDRNGLTHGEFAERSLTNHGVSSGSAARFFYSTKADKNDRMGSGHPTVKPVDLMQWLCRLVTPPGGVLLDPFAGSGSTGEAAWREGFSAILIEREAEYQADIAARLDLADKGPTTRRQRAIKQADDAGPLFGGEDTRKGGGRAIYGKFADQADRAPAANDNTAEPTATAPASCATIDVVAFAGSFPPTRSTPDEIAERRAARFGKRFNAQRSAVRAIGPHAVEGIHFITTKAGDEWSWAPSELTNAA